jgi:nitrogen PTS system EIIA component
MQIMDFLNEKAVACHLKSQNKDDVIRELVVLLVSAGVVETESVDTLVKILREREALGSTGIGQGVAIPHGKSNAVSTLIGAFGLSRDGIDYGSLDGERSHLFFLLMAPEDSAGPHLKALARISRLFKDRYLRDRLKMVEDDQALLKILTEEDQRRQ